MRLSYTDLKNQFLRNINMVDTTNTSILSDFNANLNNRYQMVLARLKNYQVQTNASMSTVAAQQYYDYPVSLTNIDDVVVTVGSVNYPLTVINSQHNWDLLNAIQISSASVPQFIFPRSPYLGYARGGGFGIWPIPQDTNTITFYYHYRDRGLSVDDYTDGTIAFTSGSGVITGTSTTFTPAMVGRSFQITTTSNVGYGYWYLVSAYSSATSITVVPVISTATSSGLAYRIAQTPLLPEEGHIVLADGVTADFYAGMRKDIETATWFNNKFWTGDGNNPDRDAGKGRIYGGLLGLVEAYNERNDERLINRKPQTNPLVYQAFATSLSN